MEVVKEGLSAVAEEVRRVRDRRGEVDRRRDDVRGERQPDGGRHVEHPVGPAVVVVAEGPGQRDGVGPRAYDGHAREDADEVLEGGDRTRQDEREERRRQALQRPGPARIALPERVRQDDARYPVGAPNAYAAGLDSA